MKTYTIVFGLICMLSFTACQKKDDGGGNNVPPPANGCPVNYAPNGANGQCVYTAGAPGSAGSCQGSCPVGQVQTAQYGCLPQNVCRQCFGYLVTTYGGLPEQGWCFPSNAAGAGFMMKANAYTPE